MVEAHIRTLHQEMPRIAVPHQKLGEEQGADSPSEPFRGNLPLWHLEFRLQVSRIGRQYVSAVSSHTVCGSKAAIGNQFGGLDKFWCTQMRVTRMVKGPATMPLEEQWKEQVTVNLETYRYSDIHLHIFEGHSDGRGLRSSPFNSRGKISVQHLLKMLTIQLWARKTLTTRIKEM